MKAEKTAVKKWPFESSSSTNPDGSPVRYETVQWEDGSLSCNCPGWTQRVATDGSRDCTHCKKVRAKAYVPGTSAILDAVQAVQASPKKEAPQAEPSLFFKPMLAHSIKDYPHALTDLNFVGEPKMDGERLLLFVLNSKTKQAYSRQGNNSLSKPGLLWLKDMVWPFDAAILDAEAVAGGGLNRGQKSAALATARTGMTRSLIFFDALSANGVDIKNQPWHERRAWLETLLGKFKHTNVGLTVYSDNPQQLWNEWVEKRGGEGLILKAKDSRYVPGWRSPHWLKWKNEITVDVIVCGMTDRARNGEKLKTSPFETSYGFWSPETKCVIEVGQGCQRGTESQMKMLRGRVMELRCAGVTSSGALISAQFVRWRNDKPATECLKP